ncbi:hypothetical protein NL676_029234 [Syzygium grande]|nr:hypothetical protein NL676_029234 [Syzygium grande]
MGFVHSCGRSRVPWSELTRSVSGEMGVDLSAVFVSRASGEHRNGGVSKRNRFAYVARFGGGTKVGPFCRYEFLLIRLVRCRDLLATS